MEIRGPSFKGYDQQYIGVVQGEKAKSIKPNLFKDMDNDVALALLLSDSINLSPEAKELLKKLRNQMKGKADGLLKNLQKEEEFNSLLDNLKDMKEEIHKKEQQELKDQGKEFQLPFHIPLSLPEKKRSSSSGGGMDPAVEALLDKMIVHSPSDGAKQLLKKELQVLGEKIISTVKQFGVHIIILARSEALTDLKLAGMHIVVKGERTFDGRPWEIVRGIYCQDRRLIVLGEERLGNPFDSVGRHEFAHAFDHTFSTKNQRRLPLSVQLWNLFQKEREGLVSNYAGVNPAEYFAESVEAFFKPGGKEALQVQDPKMFQYLENLFAA